MSRLVPASEAAAIGEVPALESLAPVRAPTFHVALRGRCCMSGDGVKRDLVRARKLFARACTETEAEGCSRLGQMYSEGIGVPQDGARGLRVHERGCDGGSADSCNGAGAAYEKGLGTVPSTERALDYYDKACELKSEPGCESAARLRSEG